MALPNRVHEDEEDDGLTTLPAVYRKRVGLSRIAVGKAIGVSRITVMRWEKGERQPSVADALLLARLYHCRVEDLFQPPEGGLIQPMEQAVPLSILRDHRAVPDPTLGGYRCAEGCNELGGGFSRYGDFLAHLVEIAG